MGYQISFVIKNQLVWLVVCLGISVVPITNLSWIHMEVLHIGENKTDTITVGLWHICVPSSCQYIVNSDYFTLLFRQGFHVVLLQSIMSLSAVWQFLALISVIMHSRFKIKTIFKRWSLDQISVAMRVTSVFCSLAGVIIIVCLRNKDEMWVNHHLGIEKYETTVYALPLTSSAVFLLVAPVTIYHCKEKSCKAKYDDVITDGILPRNTSAELSQRTTSV